MYCKADESRPREMFVIPLFCINIAFIYLFVNPLVSIAAVLFAAIFPYRDMERYMTVPMRYEEFDFFRNPLIFTYFVIVVHTKSIWAAMVLLILIHKKFVEENQ